MHPVPAQVIEVVRGIRVALTRYGAPLSARILLDGTHGTARGSQHRAVVADGPYLDRDAELQAWEALSDRRGFVDVLALDHLEAGQDLLGLGERPVHHLEAIALARERSRGVAALQDGCALQLSAACQVDHERVRVGFDPFALRSGHLIPA